MGKTLSILFLSLVLGACSNNKKNLTGQPTFLTNAPDINSIPGEILYGCNFTGGSRNGERFLVATQRNGNHTSLQLWEPDHTVRSSNGGRVHTGGSNLNHPWRTYMILNIIEDDHHLLRASGSEIQAGAHQQSVAIQFTLDRKQLFGSIQENSARGIPRHDHPFVCQNYQNGFEFHNYYWNYGWNWSSNDD